MTNSECVFMFNGLQEVNAPNMEVKFNYAIAKNLRKLEARIKLYEKASELREEYKKFLEEKEDANKKFADKDENGDPKKKVINQEGMRGQMAYVIPGDGDPKSEYTKAIEKIVAKHKPAIDARSKQVKEYNEFMQDEAEDVNLHMVDLDLVPAGLSRKAMDAVYFMIKEPVEDLKIVKKPKK